LSLLQGKAPIAAQGTTNPSRNGPSAANRREINGVDRFSGRVMCNSSPGRHRTVSSRLPTSLLRRWRRPGPRSTPDIQHPNSTSQQEEEQHVSNTPEGHCQSDNKIVGHANYEACLIRPQPGIKPLLSSNREDQTEQGAKKKQGSRQAVPNGLEQIEIVNA